MKNSQLFLMFALCFGLNAINASESSEKLPCFTKEALQVSLSDLGLDHFMEKTNIVNSLQGTKAPLGVAMALELAYADYYEDLKKGMPAPMLQMAMVQMEMHKPLIYEKLLKEYPLALAELQQYGMYKPRK